VPELPEVETVRRGLDALTRNHPIQSVEILLPRTIASPTPEEFSQHLLGQCIGRWQRRGKYLLAELQRSTGRPGGCLGVHLRMSGQLLWMKTQEPIHQHTRVRLLFDQGQDLRFVDQRTFGQMWWIPPTAKPAEIVTGLAALGPEPLSAAFSVDYLTKALTKRQRPIKTALLDQAIIAGLGNIYADEVLFLSQVHPTTICAQLTPQQVRSLHHSIRTVLETALQEGGTTFSNFLNVVGVNGNYGRAAWVYGRKGQPCRHCGTPIESLRLAGRSSHFCLNCQPTTRSYR
jgi:formamidopyrimidine-DNA glycosylase